PHHVEGRGGAADAADEDDAGKGAGLYRGRRAGRGHTKIDPPAQAPSRSQREEARREGPRSGGVSRATVSPSLYPSTARGGGMGGEGKGHCPISAQPGGRLVPKIHTLTVN